MINMVVSILNTQGRKTKQQKNGTLKFTKCNDERLFFLPLQHNHGGKKKRVLGNSRFLPLVNLVFEMNLLVHFTAAHSLNLYVSNYQND